LTIHGNTAGLAPAERKALERIYRRRVPFDVLATPELTRALADVSHATGRQVGALVDRSGDVAFVVVGDAARLMLPDLGRLRAGAGRFRGLRLVHTHLRQEALTRDDLVDLTRLRLDLVAAICLTPAGQPQSVHYAHCVPVPEGKQGDPFRTYGPIPYGNVDVNPAEVLAALEEEFARASRTREVRAKDGRAILVHVAERGRAHTAQASLEELAELARTAGVAVVGRVKQVREQPDPKFVLGRGKLEDTVVEALQRDADVLIFDRDLTPAQANAVAKMTDLKVIDRTQLILDIFAQRAESADGKLQVELAQTRYLLPRLGTRDDALSRLTGGIGGRGPGETKIEVGRRRAKERIAQLEANLARLARQRAQRRARRDRGAAPAVTIVGYTNAGKSTLLNTLTRSDVLVEDKLFATLDPRARRMVLDDGREVVVSDTVGFIRDLPRDLFAAFRATFEEASGADLLLHVVDASDPAHPEHIETTERLLADLDLDRIPRLVVLNKVDRLPASEADALRARADGVAVSAIDPRSRPEVLARVAAMLTQDGAPALNDSPRQGQR
jgi:GTP-binding protein HflX